MCYTFKVEVSLPNHHKISHVMINSVSLCAKPNMTATTRASCVTALAKRTYLCDLSLPPWVQVIPFHVTNDKTEASP